MSAISNSLLDAINTISTNAVKVSNATLTIECTITEVEDAGLQIYKVNYKDNIFSATSSSGSYNVGDIVYVLVPEGDFSKPKMILGAVVPSSANLVEEEVTDDYIEISENLFGNIDEIGLCSYTIVSPGTPEAKISIDSFKGSLLNYLNDGYRDFIFSMLIKNNLDPEQQRAGNYGLYLYLPIVVDNGEGQEETVNQILKMDVTSILGNPYRLKNYTYQEIRYTFPDNVKLDDSKSPLLEKFVVDFPLQSNEILPNDIFIKDISFKTVATLTAEQKQKYYLSLVCKDGNYFVDNSSGIKTIEPILKIKGRTSKIDISKLDCYWFIEDSSIDISSPEYSYIGGKGLRCLNDLNLETSQYITNVLSYQVKQEDVITEVRYRCILLNLDEQFSEQAFITLANKKSEIKCFLTTADNTNTYPKDMGMVNFVATVEGVKNSDRIDLAWRRLDIDTEKELNSDVITIDNTSLISTDTVKGIGNLEGKASMPVSAISSQANKIFCTFFISKEDKYGVITQKILGTKEIIILTTAEMTLHMSIQNGDILYKYDSNGNSPMVANYAYPYQAKKTIDDITFKVYKEDGTELNEDEYKYCKINLFIPKNSMIKKGKDDLTDGDGSLDHYELNGRDLNYKIEEVLNPKETNNYIILTVKFKETVLTEEINIKFVKEGESGTNGSAYTGMITFNGNTYDNIDNLKVCRLQIVYVKPESETKEGALYYNEGLIGNVPSKLTSLSFGVEVLCNGERIEDTKLYDVELDLFDKDTTKAILSKDIDSQGNIIFKPKTNQDPEHPEVLPNPPYQLPDDFCTIIAAKITVGDEGALYQKEETSNQEEIEVNEENTEENQNESELKTVKDKEVIYAYYPIEVIILEKDTLIQGAFPYIAGGYSQVLYASDGTNPQFDSTNPFRVENSTSIINNFSKDLVYTLTHSSNIRKSTDGEISYRGIPINRYNNGDSNNYIKVVMTPKKPEEEETEENSTIDSEEKKKPGEDIKESLADAEKKKKKYDEDIADLKYLLPNPDDEESGYQNYLGKFFDKITKYVKIGNDRYKYDNFKDLITKDYLSKEGMKKYLSDRQSILNKIEELKKFIDKYKDSLNKYDQDVELLRNLRIKLLNVGDKFELTEKDLLKSEDTEKEKGFIGDGLSTKTLNQFNRYREQINVNLQTFINNYTPKEGESNISKDFIILVDAFEGVLEEEHVPEPFKREVPVGEETEIHTYNNFGIYTDLISLRNTYLGVISRLIAPKEKSTILNLEIDYAFVSTYTDIEKLISQINKIFISLSRTKYIKDTKILLKKDKEELAALEIEIASLKILETYFDKQKDGVIAISHPIVMLYNRYELSNIIGLDGNKLYTGGDKEGEDPDYLLAPQVGAGRKDGNTFTGLIMGVRNHHDKQAADKEKANQVGLFGYSEGAASLFINAEDGSAIFGKSGQGQIIIDPNAKIKVQISETEEEVKSLGSGLLYSYNYLDPNDYGIDGKPGATGGYYKINPNPQGMLINLTDAYIHFNDVGTDEEASVGEAGKIYSGKHDKLESSAKGFLLSRDGLSIGSKVKITESGVMTLGTGATMGTGKHLTIDGDTNSYIAYGTTEFNKKANSVYIGTDGISLGVNKFYVTDEGYLTSKEGEIGGLSISETELSKGKIHIQPSYGILCGTEVIEDGVTKKDINLEILNSGNATFNNITCTKVFTIGDSESDNYLSNTKSGEGYATSFNFNGSGTSLGTGSAFYGGGQAIYSSDYEEPLQGNCVLQVKEIVADKISAIKVSANMIEAGAITTDKLAANAVTTEKIAAGAITASMITTALVDPTQGSITVGTAKIAKLGIYNGDPTQQNYREVSYKAFSTLQPDDYVLCFRGTL